MVSFLPMPTEQRNRSTTILIGCIVIAVLAGTGVWYYASGKSYQYSLAAGETIQNWSFVGAYNGNDELEKRAHDEITRLQGFVGKGPDTDYSYYISIANQYNLLGDGKSEYAYLQKALAIDSEHTGLAWSNVAALFERLGALSSARDAYKRAANAQASPQYITAYLEFLTEHFPLETSEIERAYAVGIAAIGEAPQLLQIRARWLEGEGRTQEAITDWKKVKRLVPASAAAADIEIKRLQEKSQH